MEAYKAPMGRKDEGAQPASAGDWLPLPFAFLAAWVGASLGRRQQQSIDYLRAENEMLRRHFGKGRLRLTDAARRLVGGDGTLRCRPVGPKGSPVGGRSASGRTSARGLRRSRKLTRGVLTKTDPPATRPERRHGTC